MKIWLGIEKVWGDRYGYLIKPVWSKDEDKEEEKCQSANVVRNGGFDGKQYLTGTQNEWK